MHKSPSIPSGALGSKRFVLKSCLLGGRGQKMALVTGIGVLLLYVFALGENGWRDVLVQTTSSQNKCNDQYHQNLKWTRDMREVTPFLKSFAEQLQKKEEICKIVEIGNGWGLHRLCQPLPQHCTFYSFGISRDYSFDVQLAEDYACQGFAADPTVTHPSKLHESVTFHQIGAKMLTGDKSTGWFSTSMPSLMKWRNDERVDILKMDCEGCEYSLAKDIAFEDPSFFDKVGQFAVEVHLSKVWLNSTEHLYSLGKLFQYLEDAGFRLAHSTVEGCATYDEAPGCMETLAEVGIPCGNGKSCHNYLFARPETAR